LTKYRYQKYFLFMCGGILVGVLAYMEKDWLINSYKLISNFTNTF
jgi:hypothetical protein